MCNAYRWIYVSEAWSSLCEWCLYNCILCQTNGTKNLQFGSMQCSKSWSATNGRCSGTDNTAKLRCVLLSEKIRVCWRVQISCSSDKGYPSISLSLSLIIQNVRSESLLCYYWNKKKTWKGEMIKNVKKKGRVRHLPDSRLQTSPLLKRRQGEKFSTKSKAYVKLWTSGHWVGPGQELVSPPYYTMCDIRRNIRCC